jgi:hypothetical protein
LISVATSKYWVVKFENGPTHSKKGAKKGFIFGRFLEKSIEEISTVQGLGTRIVTYSSGLIIAT